MKLKEYRTLILWTILLLCPFTLKSSVSLFDNSEDAEAQTPGDTLLLKRLYKLCLQNIDSPEEVMYLKELQEKSEAKHNVKYQSLAYLNLVHYYYNQLNFDSVAYYVEQAKPFLNKNKQYNYLVDVESMLILMHSSRGEYEFALVKALKIYNQSKLHKYKEGMIVGCENIGFAYQSSSRPKNAIPWYKEGLLLQEELGGKDVYKMQFKMSITECFILINQLDSAQKYLDSLNLHMTNFESSRPTVEERQACITEYWKWLYIHYAKIAIHEKHPKSAERYLKKAELYTKNEGEGYYDDLLYMTYTDYYTLLGDYNKALEYLDWSTLASRNRQNEDIVKTTSVRANIYRLMGHYAEASSLFQQLFALSDSLSNIRFSTQFTQLRSVYAMDKLEADGQHAKLRIRQLTVMTILLFLFTLLSVISLVRFYQYKKKLALITQKAKEADRQTSEFLNNMSREIKKTLHDIADLSNTIINETDFEKKRVLAGKVKSTNQTLQRVIYNVLDVSKIESDQMQFNYTSIYLPDVIREVCSFSLHLLPPHISLQIIPGADIFMRTDLVRLKQIIDNILYYIIKRAGQGEIRIGYKTDKVNIHFFVEVDGLDLSNEVRSVIFDRQAQTNNRLEDMGLDLVICKHLISKMGGTIAVSSGTKTGCVFNFTLPS